jgi:hypothetical protein
VNYLLTIPIRRTRRYPTYFQLAASKAYPILHVEMGKALFKDKLSKKH